MKLAQRVLILENRASQHPWSLIDVIARVKGETLAEALAKIGRVPGDYIGQESRRLIEVVYVDPDVV